MKNIDDFRRSLEENLKEVEAALARADASAGTVMLDQSSAKYNVTV